MNLSPLKELLSKEGNKILKRAFENQYMLIADLNRCIRPDTKSIKKHKSHVATLIKFLREKGVRIEPIAPGPDVDDIPGTVTVVSRTAEERYMNDINAIPLLSRKEEQELIVKKEKGDKNARHHLIVANLRLVVHIAKRYENYGLPVLDLINEGNIGLMKGVDRLTSTGGAKLSSYTSWWIKQKIKRALADKARVIRIPVHLIAAASKLNRTNRKLSEVFGREPTDGELAEESGLTESKIQKMRDYMLTPASIDLELGGEGEGGNRFGDFIADENAVSPADNTVLENRIENLRSMLKILCERESKILTFRYGLDGGEEKTLEQVGQKFGVTRERIRQIQETALGKLRRALEKKDRIHSPVRTRTV